MKHSEIQYSQKGSDYSKRIKTFPFINLESLSLDENTLMLPFAIRLLTFW